MKHVLHATCSDRSQAGVEISTEQDAPDGRVALQEPGQLGMRGHVALHEHGRAVRVDAGRQVQRGRPPGGLQQVPGLVRQRDRVQVHHAEEGVCGGCSRTFCMRSFTGYAVPARGPACMQQTVRKATGMTRSLTSFIALSLSREGYENPTWLSECRVMHALHEGEQGSGRTIQLLHVDPVADGAQVVAQVQGAGRLHP